jgi:hypothetical protein
MEKGSIPTEEEIQSQLDEQLSRYHFEYRSPVDKQHEGDNILWRLYVQNLFLNKKEKELNK